MRFAAVLLALCAGQAIAASSTSSSAWICLSSPSIEIFTDSSEKTARTVLRRFQTLHRVFRDSHIAESPAPLRVFLFASADDYQKYRVNQSAAAFYLADDSDLLVLQEGVALQRHASHEYLHIVMHYASAPLPLWLDEGLSEFYSTIAIKGPKMEIGDIIQPHLQLLALQPWMNAEDLAVGNRSDGPMFYAESWALVHMLSLSPPWKRGMPEFVKLLNSGRAQEEAFPTAFGKPMEDALKALRLYLRSPRELTVPAPRIDPGEAVQVTVLTPVAATLALAELAIRTGHVARARVLFNGAAKDHPESPAAAAGLARLALAENRKDDAKRELDRAIAMGYHDAKTYFELGTLKNDNALLETALSINPRLSEAHFLLGVRATDQGDFPAAIDHLEQAVAIQPRFFTYWHALGYAQAKSGDRQGAAESARRAAILASNAQEEQMAAALTQLAAEQPVLQTQKPEVTTPASWQNRKGDQRAEGILTRVDCDSSPVRLVLSTGLELKVQTPTAVELVNADGISTTLDCGEQSQPVAVEYVAATREITRIEFKHVIIKR